MLKQISFTFLFLTWEQVRILGMSSCFPSVVCVFDLGSKNLFPLFMSLWKRCQWQSDSGKEQSIGELRWKLLLGPLERIKWWNAKRWDQECLANGGEFMSGALSIARGTCLLEAIFFPCSTAFCPKATQGVVTITFNDLLLPVWHLWSCTGSVCLVQFFVLPMENHAYLHRVKDCRHWHVACSESFKPNLKMIFKL